MSGPSRANMRPARWEELIGPSETTDAPETSSVRGLGMETVYVVDCPATVTLSAPQKDCEERRRYSDQLSPADNGSIIVVAEASDSGLEDEVLNPDTLRAMLID